MIKKHGTNILKQTPMIEAVFARTQFLDPKISPRLFIE